MTIEMALGRRVRKIMNAKFWIVGGRYASTKFDALAPGAEDVRVGPFVSYSEARSAWAEMSWQALDQCNTRFVITETVQRP